MPPRIEGEAVSISADDGNCIGGKWEFQAFIVLRVAAVRNLLIWFDPNGRRFNNSTTSNRLASVITALNLRRPKTPTISSSTASGRASAPRLIA